MGGRNGTSNNNLSQFIDNIFKQLEDKQPYTVEGDFEFFYRL